MSSVSGASLLAPPLALSPRTAIVLHRRIYPNGWLVREEKSASSAWRQLARRKGAGNAARRRWEAAGAWMRIFSFLSRLRHDLQTLEEPMHEGGGIESSTRLFCPPIFSLAVLCAQGKGRFSATPSKPPELKLTLCRLMRQQDSAAGIHRQLREQLKELGFQEQVISAVLLHESGGTISLPEAIDLCLAHNDFQVCAVTPFRPVPASKPVGAILLSTLCAGRGRFT